MFDDFQKHCTECEKGTPCGKYHVYVLTLDPKIAVEKKRFRLANPDTYETGEALYVGKTECVPRCRQENIVVSRISNHLHGVVSVVFEVKSTSTIPSVIDRPK